MPSLFGVWGRIGDLKSISYDICRSRRDPLLCLGKPRGHVAVLVWRNWAEGQRDKRIVGPLGFPILK